MRPVRLEVSRNQIEVWVNEGLTLVADLDLCGDFMLDLDSLTELLEEVTDREIDVNEREE